MTIFRFEGLFKSWHSSLVNIHHKSGSVQFAKLGLPLYYNYVLK